MGIMAAAQLVIDSDILIDYLRRHADTFLTAVSHFDCGITAISLYEVLATPTLSERQQRVLSQVMALVEVLPLDTAAVEQAAEVWRSLSSGGQPIGLPDTLSAGICLAHDLPLLTRNVEHFHRVSNLRLVSPDELGANFGASQPIS
jgi:tRNA(fMet)-specific endonuclease VapC